ncbi:MAG: ATP-dependent Clp protease ATP-binding subunit [Oscillospiraceae bacterium]|nr:ATP-dependent Clp protease ATP-binding subunit [Oscillospiraceae bacterium]
MMKGFSKQSNKAVTEAIRVAGELGHISVGPEHLLAAFALLPACDAYMLLCRSSRGVPDIRRCLVTEMGMGERLRLSASDISQELCAVFDYASVCAARLGDGCVGTEQLLCAILSTGNPLLSRLLLKAGVDEQGVRRDCRGSAAPIKKDGAMIEKKPRPKSLEKYTQDLTELAADGKLDPVVGRDAEIGRVVAVLSRRKKNNACLIGEPGVGKTAVAEGIAQLIVSDACPDSLRGKRLLTLELAGMVAGTKYRGDFEERFKGALAEIVKAGDIIIFMDELHTVMGAGAAEGAIDASNILKPLLTNGTLQVIGATTNAEYTKFIEKDKAFERRFLPVRIEEPGDALARQMIDSQRLRLEEHHGVTITADAVDAAMRLSRRYIHDRSFPDKAIDLLDEASARRRMQLRGECGRCELGGREIAAVVSDWTGVPVTEVDESESERLTRLENQMRARVIGQDAAVSAVVSALKRARTGLKEPRKPSGCFLFCGPSGVGKTEVCRALAAALFGDESALVRIDMTEYSEQSAVSRLIGAPPGYVGHGEGGQLTDAVRKKPYSVVLFDEAEKACVQVFNLLLQVMDEGRLTDAAGRVVDFANCIIVLTTNVGARSILAQSGPLGFTHGDDAYKNLSAVVAEQLKSVFAPEFLNRLDETVVFGRLTMENARQIAALQLQKLAARAAEQGYTLHIGSEVADAVARAAWSPQYGARPLGREIAKRIEDPLADLILSGKTRRGGAVCVLVKDGALTVHAVRSGARRGAAAGKKE